MFSRKTYAQETQNPKATLLAEQKRSEAIVAAEKLARSILERAAEAIVVCDETGRVVRVGAVAQALSGNNPFGQAFDDGFALRPAEKQVFSLRQI